MTKSHNAWKKLLAFAISTILTFVTLPPLLHMPIRTTRHHIQQPLVDNVIKERFSLVPHMKKDIRQYLVIMD